MVKKQKLTELENEDNGTGTDSELKSILQTIIANQKEQAERLDEIEDKDKSATGEALLRMVNFLYNTDDKHIPELSRIPIQSARPLSYAMGLGSLLEAREEAIKHHEKATSSLSQRILLNYLRLMRSVGGVHLGRGIRLAEEQAAAEAEKTEEFELGGE